MGEITRLGEVTRLSKGNLSFSFDHVYMIGGVTRHKLPHLFGFPYLNRPVTRVTMSCTCMSM